MRINSASSRFKRLLASFTAAALGATGSAAILPGDASAAVGPVSDSFDGSELSSVWSVVDPVGDGSVGLDGAGSLVLSVPAGSRHVIWHANDSVRAMQPAANADFEVELAFGSVPSLEYQLQGLLVEQDADDWVRFDFHSTSTKLRVFGASTAAGKSSKQFQKTIQPPASGELLMRVSRVGDVWSMDWSGDGVSWNAAGSFTHALNVTGVGPFVSNSGDDPAFSAVLDEFVVVGADPAYGLSVSTAGSGSGSVSTSPEGTSFPAGTEVTLTATPDAGSVFAGWSGDVSSASSSITVTMDADVSVVATFDPDLSDVTPPVISGVVVSGVSDSSATISWVTDEPATSVVSYGPTAAYEDGSVGDAALVTSHSVTLTGLAAESTYHFQVSSTDGAGNTSTAPDDTFTTAASSTSVGPVSDSFDGSELSSVWSVVDPVGDGSVGLDGVGSLVLSVPAGSRHVIWHANDSVRAMQPAVDGDFEVELAFGSVPSLEYQLQGLLVEQDADDWVRFDFHSTSSKLRVFGASTAAGSSSSEFMKTIQPPASGELFMRVSRVGDVWSMDWSGDGVSWNAAGSFTHALNVTGVGPFVSNSGDDPAFSAVLDEFVVVDAEQGYTLSVSTAGDGSGSVSTSPEGSSFPAGTDVTLTAEADPGSVFAGWSGDVSGTSSSITVTMNADVSVVATFDPDSSDVTPPVISDVVVSGVTDSSATISWVTDEPATSVVSYGPTTAYEDGSVTDATLVTSHSVTLTGLAAESTYHFQVSSTDGAGNTSTAPDDTFTTTGTPEGAPVIDVWHGAVQPAGTMGRPQRWFNVVGNANDPDGISSLTYSLNGSADLPLEMGPDNRRLAEPGDFNVQLAFDDLAVGDNTVLITATDTQGLTTSSEVTVQLAPASTPSLPFQTSFATAGSIQEQATVVDAPWRINADGTANAGVLAYDRTLAVGDAAWSDYEVQFDATVHGFGTDYETPESGYAAGIGLGLRWDGHSGESNEQLYQDWYPTGAFVMHKWFNGEGWWLRGNDNTPYDKASSPTPELGVTYTFKARVETVPDGTAYSFKVWEAGTAEPSTWKLSIVEDNGPATGGILLIAHHVDADFGDVSVTPLS